MIFNQLNTLPTEETMHYLSSVMAGAPLDIDLTSFKVEVITTKDALEYHPDRVYQAEATSVKVWYDAALGTSSLIISLNSPDLQRRGLELAEEGVLREFFDFYNPYLRVRPNMPALSKHYRTFIYGLANALCSNQRPLEFTSEYVTQVDLINPVDYDYNMAMIAERGHRRI